MGSFAAYRTFVLMIKTGKVVLTFNPKGYTNTELGKTILARSFIASFKTCRTASAKERNKVGVRFRALGLFQLNALVNRHIPSVIRHVTFPALRVGRILRALKAVTQVVIVGDEQIHRIASNVNV